MADILPSVAENALHEEWAEHEYARRIVASKTEGKVEGFDLSLKIMSELVAQTPIRQIVETLGVTESQVVKVRDALQNNAM